MTNNEPATDAPDGDQLSKLNSLTYSIDDESPSEAIVRAVSTLKETEVRDLDPLYHAIDPGYVDGMFENLNGDVEEAKISFEFNDCRVTVTPEKIRAEKMTDTS